MAEKCVLVVEDDAALSLMLQELPEGEGYPVVTAQDGRHALHDGLSRGFDVIVTVVYLVLVEFAKQWFFSRPEPQPTPGRQRGHSHRIHRRASRFSVPLALGRHS
ncbi:response regulator [Arthrobacter alpinus]|nr:response regulator [Arthrobacter alpinus]MDD0857697.1 response regulator [Arthrobacter alpinus]